jgi:hypothetical protein
VHCPPTRQQRRQRWRDGCRRRRRARRRARRGRRGWRRRRRQRLAALVEGLDPPGIRSHCRSALLLSHIITDPSSQSLPLSPPFSERQCERALGPPRLDDLAVLPRGAVCVVDRHVEHPRVVEGNPAPDVRQRGGVGGVAGEVGALCPGRKPSFLAVEHPVRPYRSPIQNLCVRWETLSALKRPRRARTVHIVDHVEEAGGLDRAVVDLVSQGRRSQFGRKWQRCKQDHCVKP